MLLTHFEFKKENYFMETVRRRVYNPITTQEYQIELPAPMEIKKAVRELDFPSVGLMPRRIAAMLAEKFNMSKKQANAKYKSQVEASSGDTVWRDMLVLPALRELLNEGTLEQPRGSNNPYVLVTNNLENTQSS